MKVEGWANAQSDLTEEELFNAYAESVLFGGAMAAYGNQAGNNLSGNTKLAYEALKPVLAEIASGQRSSAVITLGDQLGEVTFDDGTTETCDAEISATFDAGNPELDDSALLYALLTDMPYELYWFDKVTGFEYECVTYGNGIFYKFCFTVGGSYQVSEYTIDTTKTGAATTAAANAKAVVDQVKADVTAKTDYTDYDILLAYKKWICNAVSYNEDAATAGNFSERTDPWQIIYVFDNDSSTNVVCEGYAKAFQYLCELTEEFKDKNFACYTVTGNMSANGGNGEGHMWNIVHLDGENYLVDVTNSDTNTIGKDGELFLAGATGSVSAGYTITIEDQNSVTYTYDDDTTDLWSTTALTLATGNYAIPEEDTIDGDDDITSTGVLTQEAFVQAMENCEDGFYSMAGYSMEITSDMVIPENIVVWMSNGSSLTVKKGATLTVNGQLTAKSSTITVEEGATLVNNFCLSLAHGGDASGKITIDGTLINNDSVIVGSGNLALNGEYVDDANTEIQSFIGSVEFDWIHASITNMDQIKGLVYETVVTTEDELRSAVVRKTGDQFVNIQKFITLNEDLTIPQGVAVNTGYSYDPSVTTYQNGLIVPGGVTLTNQGSLNVISCSKLEVLSGGTLNNENSIYVKEGCALLCEGTFIGNQPYGNGIITGTGETEDSNTDEQPVASFEIDYKYYMFFENGDVFYDHNTGTQDSPNWTRVEGSLPEGITFDKDTNTLTLKDQELQYIGAFYEYYHENTGETEYGLTENNWTIQLEGENTISNMMELWGGLTTTFAGTGSLTFEDGATARFFDGITINDDTTLALAEGAKINTADGAIVTGNITVDGTVCTMGSYVNALIRNAFNQGYDVKVDSIVYLDQDLEVSLGEDGGELTILNGSKIVIPDGRTMTIYNPTNVMGGAEIEVLSGGKLVIEGSMGVFNQGKVTVKPGGTIYTSGNVWIDSEGLVLVKKGGIAQYHDNNCWIDGNYVNENEGETNTYLYGVNLDWSDDGWHINPEGEIERFRGVTAFQDSYVIFYAHTFDFETMQWKDVPVVPEAGSSNYTITRLTELDDVMIKDGEENTEYFVQISAYKSLYYWQDTINFTVGDITMKNYRFEFYDHSIATYTSETPSEETCIVGSATMDTPVYLLPLKGYTIANVTWELDDWCKDYGEKYCDNEDLLAVTELDNGGRKFEVNSKFTEYCKYEWMNFRIEWHVTFANANDPDGVYQWDGDTWFNPAEDSMPEPVANIGINDDYYHFYDTGMITRDYFTGNDEEGNEIWNRQVNASLPDGVFYNHEANTMTLENATLSRLNVGCWFDDEGNIQDLPSKDFTLNLVGDNKLENSTAAPLVAGNLNIIISGTGSLTVLAHNSTDNENAFSAMQLFDGSNLTIQGSASVYVCTDGKGYYYDENGKPFNADLNCISGGDQRGTLTIKDSATLTTRVPDGAYVVDEISDHPMRYNVICGMNILVQGNATFNTDMLLMMDGDTLTQNGGTINIEAPESVFLLDDGRQWHNYEGIYACKGSIIELNSGVMNISQASETDGSGFFYGIQVTDEGTGKGSSLNITGGTLNITANARDGLGILVDTCSQMNMSGGVVNLTNNYTVASNDYWASIQVCEPYNGDDTNGVLNLSGGTINAENWAWIFTLNMTGGQFNLKNNEKISLSTEDQANNENNSLLRARMNVTFGSIDGGEINITNGTLINRNNFGMGGETNGQKYGTGKITIRNTMERVVGLVNEIYFPLNAGTLDIEVNHFAAIETSGTFHQMGGMVRAVDTDRGMNVIHSTGSVLLNNGEMNLSGYIGVMQFAPATVQQSGDEEETQEPVFLVSGGTLNIDAEYRGIWNKGNTELNGGEVNITITNESENANAGAIVSEYSSWKSEDKSDAKVKIGGAEVTVNENIQAFELEITGGSLTMKGDNVVKLDVNAGSISGGEINITNGVMVNQMNFSIDGGTITIDNTTGSTNENPIAGLINNLYLPINGGKVDIKTNYCSPIINNGTFHQMGGTLNAETEKGAALWNKNVFQLNNGTLNLKGESGICATTDKGENSVTTEDAVVQVTGGELNITATYRGIWSDLPIDLSHDVGETGMADSAKVNITMNSEDGDAAIYTTGELTIHSDVTLTINSAGKGIRADNATVTLADTPDVTITAKGETLYSENDSETDTGFVFNGVELTNQNYYPLTFENEAGEGDAYIHKVTTSPVRIKSAESIEMATVNSWDELTDIMEEVDGIWYLNRNVTIGKSFTIPESVNVRSEITIPNKVTLSVSGNMFLYIMSGISVKAGGKLTINQGGYLSFQDESKLDVEEGATLTNNGGMNLNQNIGMPYEGTGYTHVYGTYSQGKNAHTYANVHSSIAVEGIQPKNITLNAYVYSDGEEVLDMFLERYNTYGYANNSYANLFAYTIRKDLVIPKGVTLNCEISYFSDMVAPYGILRIDEGVAVVVNGQLNINESDNFYSYLYNKGSIVVGKGGILSITGEIVEEGTITNNGGKILPAAKKVTVTKAEDEPETYDISDKDLTAKLNVTLDSNLSQVTWTSSNKNIVDASAIERDANGNWIVPFTGKAVGKVTLTATAIDGGKAKGTIALNTSFLNDGKLTATLTDTVVAGSLQPGESGKLVIKCGDEELDMDQLIFKVAKDGIVDLDEEAGEVIGQQNKSGSVKITATLKDDPKKRSVSITVKTIVAQIMEIEIWDMFPNFEKKITGLTYTTEMSAEEQVLTLGADLIYADYISEEYRNEATKSNITWTTTDAKVAKVTVNADGTAKVTIPAGASGAATITVTAKDSLKQQASVEIVVKDYTPKLRSSTITMNTKQYAGQWLNLLESYGNKITGVTVMKDTKGTVDPRFGVGYDDENGDAYGNWYIYAKDTLKNGNYKVKLLVTSKEHPEGDYLDLTITVKNSTPKITVTQNGKFNLFYTDRELPITVTAEGYNIDAIVNDGDSDFEVSFHEGWDDAEDTSVVDCFIEFSCDYVESTMSGYKKPNTKIKVEVWLEGYREPVSTTITVQTETVKPTLELWYNNLSYNTALGDVVPTNITIKNVTDDDFISLSQELRSISLSSTNGAKLDTEQFRIYYQKTPTKSGTNKITIQCKNWTQAMTLTQNITINTKLPTAKLSATTLTLNNNYPSNIVSTGISCSEKITSIVIKNKTSEARLYNGHWGGPGDGIAFTFEDGKIDVWFYVTFPEGDVDCKHPITPEAGTYSYTITPYVSGADGEVALKAVTLTVKVVNTKHTVKASSTMKLNTNFTEHVASTTLTTNQTDVAVIGFTDNFVATGKNAAEGKKISVWYDADSGEVKAKLDPEDLPKTGTYTFQASPKVRYTGNPNGSIDGIDNFGKVTVTVKVESTKPTVKLSTTSVKLNTYFVNHNVSSDSAVITPTLTNKTGIDMKVVDFRVDSVEGDKLGAYAHENVALAYDEESGELTATLISDEVVKNGFSFKLYPVVEYAGGEEFKLSSPVTLKVTPYNATPTVTVSASGKLDTLNRDTGITYTVTKLNNVVGKISDVVLLDEDGTVMGEPHFELMMGEENAKGQQTITMKLFDKADYYVNATYHVRLGYYINGELVPSDVLNIKVTRSTLKVSVTSGTTQFYQSEGRLRFSLNITSPADTYFEAVFVNTSKTSKELLEAMDIDVENGGYYCWIDDFKDNDWNRVDFSGSVPYPGRLTAGKSYNLYLDVYPKGGAKDNPTTVQVTVKVNK